ncbi:MAG: hypothetical protein ABIR87_00635 [Sphingomicrobium sp.]
MPISGSLRLDQPEHPASHVEALIRRGEHDRALHAIDALLLADPQKTKFLRIKFKALMGLRQFDAAAGVIGRAVEIQPSNIHYRKLHAIALKDSRRDDLALPMLEQLHGDDQFDLEVISALCVLQYRAGNHRAALRFGQLKLDLLQEAAPAIAATASAGNGEQCVVSFSLWGAKPQYCDGALRNAEQVAQVLPGWSARFYTDASVPADLIALLGATGASIVDCADEISPPMMRRFLVHDDPYVDRYIIRDRDSRIGQREVVALDDWLASGLRFHAMRDHPFHNELMMGGMWGGTANTAFSMQQLLGEFYDRHGIDHSYGLDQQFLRQYVWPRVAADMVTHDSHYSTPGSRDYPDGSRGTEQDHIGVGLVL